MILREPPAEQEWETSFFESAFTHQNAQHRLTTHSAGFVGLWRELAGKKSDLGRKVATPSLPKKGRGSAKSKASSSGKARPAAADRPREIGGKPS